MLEPEDTDLASALNLLSTYAAQAGRAIVLEKYSPDRALELADLFEATAAELRKYTPPTVIDAAELPAIDGAQPHAEQLRPALPTLERGGFSASGPGA